MSLATFLTAQQTHRKLSRRHSLRSRGSRDSLALRMPSSALKRTTSSVRQKEPQRCWRTSLMASIDVCWLICWFMTAFTIERATSRPLAVVRRSSYVRLSIDC